MSDSTFVLVLVLGGQIRESSSIVCDDVDKWEEEDARSFLVWFLC